MPREGDNAYGEYIPLKIEEDRERYPSPRIRIRIHGSSALALLGDVGDPREQPNTAQEREREREREREDREKRSRCRQLIGDLSSVRCLKKMEAGRGSRTRLNAL